MTFTIMILILPIHNPIGKNAMIVKETEEFKRWETTRQKNKNLLFKL